MLSSDLPPVRIGQRIAIIGTTGSGKTTLARQLAQCLDVPHVELDALHWGPGWTEASPDVFSEHVLTTLNCPGWIVDGNYRKVRDLVWSRADTVIWLDYSLRVTLWHLFRRTLRRVITREELWGGNYETWRTAFLSRESLFIFALRTYSQRRRDYPVLLARPEFAHLLVVHLRSPRVTARWLSKVRDYAGRPCY